MTEEKKQETTKQGDVDHVVEEIKEKFGDGMLMKLGDIKKVDVASISVSKLLEVLTN